MKLPQAIWNQVMRGEKTLHQIVEYAEPVIQPLGDRVGFTNVWKNRLDMAESENHLELAKKSRGIVNFLANHSADSLVLLMWIPHKIAILFDPDSEEFLLISD